MSQEVIELSIDETNKLRAELGLAPLRLSTQKQEPQQYATTPSAATEAAADGEEILEMSVDETNALREKLGLPPLRASNKKEAVIHKPAENESEKNQVAERIAAARLRRQVQTTAKSVFGEETLADNADTSALSWAEQMRRMKDNPQAKVATKGKNKKGKDSTYDERNLEGLQVAHNLNDLETGETTVLTLADAPLLTESLDEKTSKRQVGLNEDDIALENINLAESKKQQDGLRKKRLLEMGMGRAGGYAGFDDDEFEELGGTLGPSQRQRGNALLDGDSDSGLQTRGFRIGNSKDLNGDSSATDFDKIQMGKAISLVPEKADVAANDYMTLEEEEAERAARKKKKDGKFKKKKKKKDKKSRKTHLDSSDEEGTDEATPMNIQSSKKLNVLETLEETAIPIQSGLRKRRRLDDDDNDENLANPAKEKDMGFVSVDGKTDGGSTVKKDESSKRAKFDAIMDKGNERTRQAFTAKKTEATNDYLDEEPDDSFLNAALAKARRLNRLREMDKPKVGAQAIAEAVKASTKDQPPTSESSSGGDISFAIDDTREFTLALQARSQQKEREAEKAKQQRLNAKANQIVKKEENLLSSADDTNKKGEEIVVETAEDEDVDMEELAKEVKVEEPENNGLDGGTARSAGVGRGLSSFVSMLKTTGEISNKGTKEELKGRAKDERNYENYAPMDLSKVVKIGRNATDIDRELASREVKLEYRDKHGRLLTAKEAYRDLCYQFHGHGASKKKEEKRLKQIEREQAQTRMASQQVAAARDGTTASTLGALKATQKATGKAYIVHKT